MFSVSQKIYQNLKKSETAICYRININDNHGRSFWFRVLRGIYTYFAYLLYPLPANQNVTITHICHMIREINYTSLLICWFNPSTFSLISAVSIRYCSTNFGGTLLKGGGGSKLRNFQCLYMSIRVVNPLDWYNTI